MCGGDLIFHALFQVTGLYCRNDFEAGLNYKYKHRVGKMAGTAPHTEKSVFGMKSLCLRVNGHRIENGKL